MDGNAVRSKIKDFRTALYPRQYHLSVLEKPLIKRLFAYKVFFRRTCRRKNKIRLTAAEKLNLRFIDRLKRVPDKTGTRFLIFIHSFESIFSIELSFLKSISQGLLQSDQLSVSSETSPG